MLIQQQVKIMNKKTATQSTVACSYTIMNHYFFFNVNKWISYLLFWFKIMYTNGTRDACVGRII